MTPAAAGPVTPDGATLALGVIAGLVAALFSAVSYFIARDHTARGGQSAALLVLGHAIMAAVCLPATWWLWPAGLEADARWVLPLAGSATSYLLGQALVFAALERAGASRVAPLLGLKIAILAGLGTLRPGGGLDGRQWAAVGMSVVAATMLSRGGGMPAAALALTLAACLTFAISDICIVELIGGLQHAAAAAGSPIGRLRGGILAMTATYAVCGMIAAAASCTRWTRPRGRDDWLAGAAYAAAWLAAMVGLYTCFGAVGAVFGNILQSTRGMIAIVLGAVLAHLGRHDLEVMVDRATLVRRLVAAALMTGAIALFVIDLS